MIVRMMTPTAPPAMMAAIIVMLRPLDDDSKTIGYYNCY
jgi:hypothetical protein